MIQQICFIYPLIQYVTMTIARISDIRFRLILTIKNVLENSISQLNCFNSRKLNYYMSIICDNTYLCPGIIKPKLLNMITDECFYLYNKIFDLTHFFKNISSLFI